MNLLLSVQLFLDGSGFIDVRFVKARKRTFLPSLGNVHHGKKYAITVGQARLLVRLQFGPLRRPSKLLTFATKNVLEAEGCHYLPFIRYSDSSVH